MDQEKLELIKKSIRTIPDFPKEGILFRDITTALQEPKSFKAIISLFSTKRTNLYPKKKLISWNFSSDAIITLNIFCKRNLIN